MAGKLRVSDGGRLLGKSFASISHMLLAFMLLLSTNLTGAPIIGRSSPEFRETLEGEAGELVCGRVRSLALLCRCYEHGLVLASECDMGRHMLSDMSYTNKTSVFCQSSVFRDRDR